MAKIWDSSYKCSFTNSKRAGRTGKQLDGLDTWGRGSVRDSLRAYSVGFPATKQKDHHPARRYLSMRRRLKAIIQTAIATIMLCGIWQMLEYLIYGEIQPRIVDDIMILFFIPFIYISARV